MKQFNFTLTDRAHKKLEEIKKAEGISNNSEAFEFLINKTHKQMQEKQAKDKDIELGGKRSVHP